jgi:hypothetical protein
MTAGLFCLYAGFVCIYHYFWTTLFIKLLFCFFEFYTVSNIHVIIARFYKHHFRLLRAILDPPERADIRCSEQCGEETTDPV